MKGDELRTLIREYGETDEPHKFERVAVKFTQRADLHAFILLDKLLPSNMDIIRAAEHDEIYFEIDIDELAKVITHEQVLELVRCGISYDSHNDSLYSFV